MYRAKRSGPASRSTDRSGKPRRRAASPCSPTSQTDSSAAISRWSTSPSSTSRPARSIGVEALLRWDHPTHGRIGPGEFVSLAEHTDLIGPITDFVISRAVEEIAPIDGLPVAINVSARNLEDRHFAGGLLAKLDDQHFPAHRLEIEITESALSHRPRANIGGPRGVADGRRA